MKVNYYLRDPIYILVRAEQDDGCGGIIITWSTKKIIWGSVKLTAHYKILLSSHTMVKHGLIVKEDMVFQIIIRNKSDLKVADRIKWKDHLMCVVSDPVPTERLGYDIFYACKIDKE